MSSEERSPSGRISAALRRDAANQVAEPVVPPATPKSNATKARGIWIAAAIAGVAVVAMTIWISTNHKKLPPAVQPVASEPYLNLDLRSEGDQLKLTSSTNVTSIRSAHLDVFDGNSIKQLDVTDDFKAQQAITVPHSTGNVQVVMTVDSADGGLVRKAGFTDSAAVLRSESKPAPAPVTPIPKPTSTRHKRHRRGR